MGSTSIGHSLGAPVNAAAANYLQQDQVGQQEISPVKWSVPIHVTLLDEAGEWGTVWGAPRGLFNGLTVSYRNGVAPPVSEIIRWKWPTPIHLTWADNYVSTFGYQHRDTVTIFLTKAPANPLAGHSYAHEWYRSTVSDPTHCILGFQESYEAKLAGISTFAYAEASVTFFPGSYYEQSSLIADPLLLVHKAGFKEAVGNVANRVVSGFDGAAEVVGDVSLQVRNTAQSAGDLISQSFTYVANVAERGGEAVVSFFDTAVLTVNLRTASAPSPFSEFGVKSSSGNSLSPSNSAAMAWLPIRIPTDAKAMAFDFIVSGDPVDDSLVCGVGTNSLFSLEAKYIPTNTISASHLLDVSPWAGMTNDVFFGLLGGTSTNALVEVENIRFYSLESPQLAIRFANQAVVLRWPQSASVYVLESSPDVTTTNGWTIVTNIPVLSGDYLSVTNDLVLGGRFYRLRQ